VFFEALDNGILSRCADSEIVQSPEIVQSMAKEISASRTDALFAGAMRCTVDPVRQRGEEALLDVAPHPCRDIAGSAAEHA